jgi:hypothetical protein
MRTGGKMPVPEKSHHFNERGGAGVASPARINHICSVVALGGAPF